MERSSLSYMVCIIALISCGCSSRQEKAGLKTGTQDSPQAPNIVLIVADDHGNGDLGCYGNPAVHTPNLDGLAAEGIRFNRAHCTSASCSASRSVIMTGMFNHAIGHYGHAHAFHHFSTFDQVLSLPVMLEQLGGYRTARVGKYHLAPEKVYQFQKVFQADQRNPVEMSDVVSGFISEESDRPFFLYYCTSDPHRSAPLNDEPMAPDAFGNREGGYPGVEEKYFSPDEVIIPPYLPGSEACREELAQYYQSVARVDYGLGRLFSNLKEAGEWDNTIVVYISDNGIAFPGAKTTIYQPGINLPCLIKNADGSHAGRVSEALVSWVDLTPTLLDMAGVLPDAEAKIKEVHTDNSHRRDNPYKGEFQGRSFRRVLEDPAAEGFDEIYASHTFHEITMYYPMRTVISGKMKLIWNLAWQLPYPSASDLWSSSTYQAALASEDRMYGPRSIEDYIQRAEFELYDLDWDPLEADNLVEDPSYADQLVQLKAKLKSFQVRTGDPWVVKWSYE